MPAPVTVLKIPFRAKSVFDRPELLGANTTSGFSARNSSRRSRIAASVNFYVMAEIFRVGSGTVISLRLGAPSPASATITSASGCFRIISIRLS